MPPLLLLLLTPTAQAACPSRLTAEALEARLLAAQDPVVYAEPAAEATLDELEALLRGGCVDGPVPKSSLAALFLAQGAYETLRPGGDPVAGSLAYDRAAALQAAPEPAYGADVRDALARASGPRATGTLDLWPAGATLPIYLDGEALQSLGEHPAPSGVHLVQWTTTDGAWSGAWVELRPGERVAVGERPAPIIIVRELPPEPSPEPGPEQNPELNPAQTPEVKVEPTPPVAKGPPVEPTPPAAPTSPEPFGLTVTLGAEIARYTGLLSASPAAFDYVHPRGGLLGAVRYGQRGYVELTSHLAPASPVALPENMTVLGGARIGGPHQLGLSGGLRLGERWGGELGLGALAVWAPTMALVPDDALHLDVRMGTTRAIGPELHGALIAQGQVTVKLQGRAAWLHAAEAAPRWLREAGLSLSLPVSPLFAPAMSIDVGALGPERGGPESRLLWTRAWGGVVCSF